MTFDLKAEVARATDAWLAANTVGIPASIRKPVPPEPTLAERILGRPICSDTRRYDERELKRTYNRMGDDE